MAAPMMKGDLDVKLIVKDSWDGHVKPATQIMTFREHRSWHREWGHLVTPAEKLQQNIDSNLAT
jgi:hypothetical protein